MPTENDYAQDLLNSTLGIESQQRVRNEIDILASNMLPIITTASGEAAARKIIGDTSKPSEVRAAAAQALNPGMQASVGPNGELMFSQKPGSDLGTDYSRQINSITGKRSTKDILNSFDNQFAAIQQMDDAIDVMNTYASLQGAAVSYINEKRGALQSRVEQATGLRQAQSALRDSQILDREHYAAYYGGVDQGPSVQTLNIMQQLTRAQQQTDRDVEVQLQRDPEIAILESKLKTLDTFVAARYKDFQDPSKRIAIELLPEQQIDATMLALGANPNDTVARAKVAEGLVSNNQVMQQAQAVGSASPVTLAATAASEGVVAQQAKRVLEARMGNPSDTATLIKGIQNFERSYPDEFQSNKDLYELSAADRLGSPNTQAAAQEAIQNRKAQFVLGQLQANRAQQFKSTVAQWQPPQDDMLEEVPRLIQDAQRADPAQTIDLDWLISRMDWTGANRGEKIRSLAAYVNSQAKLLPANDFYGAPMQYADPLMTERLINTIVTWERRKQMFRIDEERPRARWTDALRG